MTNPVTGATESYTYKFIGTDSVWNNAANWQDSNGSSPSAVPAASGSNTWVPILFDQAENQSIAIGAALSVEGWNLRMGLYNGASVQLNNLVKLQSDTATWITVDSSSHCTIAHMVNKKLVGANPLCLYSANEGGIAWTEELSSSGNGNGTPLPFHYYLAGNGTVAYNGGIAAAAGGAHVIKQADVTLSGTSEVVPKPLVSFSSSSTTFTADAAIKVYDTDGTTLKKLVGVTAVRQSGATIENTVSQLTTANAVGSCEIVQCTDGIVLYYVDGAPSAVTGYTPSININFTSGTALSTAGNVGLADYAVPGTSWNNLTVANNATLSSLNKIDSTGAATASPASVTITNTRGEWHCSSLVATSDLRAGYIDETADVTTPTVTVSGITYDKYKVVVYTATDAANVKFGYVTINGTDYTYSDGAVAEGTTAWGASGAQNTAEALAEGVNVLVSPVVSGGTLTVVGHRSGTNPRGCIAAVQIVKVEQEVGENDLFIELDGDRTYTFDEAKAYSGTVYVTGEGTLTFDGAASTAATLHIGPAAAVNIVGSALTPTTVTGNGTVVYDGVQPSTTLGFSDAANWQGTVWVKNVGDTSKGETDASNDKVTTCLGSGSGTAEQNTLNNWGNASSFVKFTNVRGYMSTANVPWTLVLEDDGDTKAWYNNNGWTDRSITIAALKGDGSIWDISDGGCRPFLNFGDASQFTGTIKVLGKQVFLNDTSNTGSGTSLSGGRITVPANQTLTVASGKTWHTSNGLVVNGTLNVNGTLASDSTTAAVSGSGTVVFAGSAPSPTGDAWWKNANWTGTVQMKAVTLVGTSLAFNDYGNTGSVLELNGCSGWLTPAYTCTVPLKITGTLSLNNGYSNKGNAFKVGTLLGDGTISGSSSAPTMVFNVTTDWSGFTGKIALNNKCVVFGSTIPDSLTEGRIYIAEGAQVTVQNTAGAAWWGVGGIQVDGELRANSLDRFGGGTTITTTDNGVFTLTSTGNGSESETDTDYARITGTGSLKYDGTGWRALSTTNFPTAVTLVNEQVGDILLSRARTYTVGSLSGSKNFQGNYGSGSRYLNVIQSKDTEWSGKVVNDGSSRFAGLKLDASSTGTLTLSGTASQNVALEVNGGAVNLTGTWVGATTVSGTFGGTGTLTGNLTFSDGATFKAGASALTVSGTVTTPGSGTVTVDVSAISESITASGVTLISGGVSEVGTFAVDSAYRLDVDGSALKVYRAVTYVAEYNGVPYETVKAAIDAAEQAGGTYADVTILDENATCPDGYYIDTENNNVLKKYAAAAVTVGVTTTTQWFTTFQEAIDAAVADNQTTYAVAYADGTATASVTGANVFMLMPNGYDVTVMCSVAGYGAYAQGLEIQGFAGLYPYSAVAAAATFTWTGAEGDNLWETAGNWSSEDGTVAAAPANSLYTVVLNTAATIKLDGVVAIGTVNVGAAVTLNHVYGKNATLDASSIVLTAAGASLAKYDDANSMTLSHTPTTNVSHSRVKTVTEDGTTTYSVEVIPGTIFLVY